MRMPASSPFIIFFIIGLVLAGCFTMGCSTPNPARQPNETQQGTDIGFPPVTTTREPQEFTFREARANIADLILNEGNSSAANVTSMNQILYIRGSSLNENGGAKSWIFAVRNNNKTSIVTYDRHGGNIAEWKDAFPWQEIQLDSVILPEDLFQKNRETIIPKTGENVTESRDLVLAMGNYTLTISGRGTTRVMVFDAKTGALIRSNG
jgi:hypothetical protein